MSGPMFDLLELFARRSGAELPPHWKASGSGDALDGSGREDLRLAARRMGWSDPIRVNSPRAHQFPLMAFLPDGGWAIAEQWEAPDVARVSRPGWTGTTTVTSQAFFDLPLPRLIQEGGAPRALTVFIRALAKRKGVFASAILATVVVNLLALATSLYSMQVYDRVIPRGGLSTLWVLTVGVAFALLLDFMLRLTRSLMIEREAARIDGEISEYFFARAQAVRLDARPPGVGTMAAQLRGWEQVRALLSSGFVFLLADLPFALLFVGVIASLGGALGFVPLASLPLAIGLALIFARLIQTDTAKSLLSANRKNGVLVESFDAAETIKANRAGWHMLARWNALIDELHLHEDPVRRWSSIATSVFGALQQLAYIGMVAWGAVLVGQGQMTMGGLIACTILAGRVNGPLIGQLPGFLVQWSYARSSLQALDGILRLPIDQAEGSAGLRPEKLEATVAATDLSFAYVEDRPAVDGVNLTIRPGERVAVIGGIGSGKSTLLRLLSGLYAAQRGSVTIGGLEVSQIAPDVLRRHVGYLAQDTRLLNGTLRENILLGLTPPGDQAVMAVLDEIGLAPLVQGHPRGLDLTIAEGGRGLSGGQRTLANLGRLLLSDPDIWLLDEPTANLDQGTEARVLDAVRRRLGPTKSLVLVTHRMSLLSLCDRVVVLAKGKVVLDGPTDQVTATLKASAKTGSTALSPVQA